MKYVHFQETIFEYVNNSNSINDIPLVIHHWKPCFVNYVLMEQRAILVFPYCQYLSSVSFSVSEF